jgi:LuxR family maltose regulon positive regulatory protein
LFTYIPWAYALFEGNELAKARQYFEICAETCYKLGTTPTVIGGANLMAEINFFEGEIERAMSNIHATVAEATQLGWPWIARNAAAVEAWLNLKQGHLAEVETWERETRLPLQANPTRDVEQLVQARLFIARGQWPHARGLLEQMRNQAVQAERVALLIEIQILLAIVEEHEGHHDSALTWIEQAARQAAPENTLRPFLNDDTRILANGLRARLNARDELTLANFLDQIMGYSGMDTPSPRLSEPVQPRAQSAGLVEPVTPRELDVLRLMASGLTNADIARELFLTVNTLKAHTNTIYGKLAVHSRIQAVNRARELGLLPSSTPD